MVAKAAQKNCQAATPSRQVTGATRHQRASSCQRRHNISKGHLSTAEEFFLLTLCNRQPLNRFLTIWYNK